MCLDRWRDLYSLKGRFFYRMVDDSLPQWIRTYPVDSAPRTGDGLFPGEVIEVTQVCTACTVVKARFKMGYPLSSPRAASCEAPVCIPCFGSFVPTLI